MDQSLLCLLTGASGGDTVHSAEHTEVSCRATMAVVEATDQSVTSRRSPSHGRGFERERGKKNSLIDT